ncbi:MAG: hypothetical protein WCY19_04445 [Candidatus Gastranaerophilaceae bacterium]
MKIKKIVVFLAILGFGIMPSFAKIDGGISKNHFYDTDKTIMTEIIADKTIKTGKYWEKNMFYSSKYRPLFMLSNKELYDLMPSENVSIIQRITTPSVYNISLKTSSIKKVSFTPIVQKSTEPKRIVKIVKNNPKPDLKLISAYEDAKNPQTEPEKKIEAAILLKNSQNPSNYALAIDLLDDVTKKEPYNAYAFYLKGELYLAQKNPESAMKNYIEALKINPASKQSCYGIAKILEPTNKELAQKYYDRAK